MLPRKSYVYDVMHRTLVTGLIGLGAFTGGLLVYKTYEYFTVIKPLKEQRVKMMREEQMLAEQQARELNTRENELVQQQKQAESM